MAVPGASATTDEATWDGWIQVRLVLQCDQRANGEVGHQHKRVVSWQFVWRFADAGHDDPCPARRQPASAKRQWTKSREVGVDGAAGATRVWCRHRRWWVQMDRRAPRLMGPSTEWWGRRPGTSGAAHNPSVLARILSK